MYGTFFAGFLTAVALIMIARVVKSKPEWLRYVDTLVFWALAFVFIGYQLDHVYTHLYPGYTRARAQARAPHAG